MKVFLYEYSLNSFFLCVELFRALEEHNNTSDGCTAPLIGVNSYGVSMTTLEEVFLQLESSNEKENDLASTAESGVRCPFGICDEILVS